MTQTTPANPTSPGEPDLGWLRAARARSLLLDDVGASTPVGPAPAVADVVRWFGAMQGQDLPGVIWSLGVRTGASRDAVISALGTGEVLRTWPMRGTLHVVPGRDSRWMLAHLGQRALAGAAARRAFLGLEEADADRACDVLGQALVGGRALTRAECVATLEDAGIPAAGQRAYHLLWYSSQRGVTCVGPQRGSQQTFVLLEDHAPPGPDLDRDEALAVIAHRFLRSHGPASVHDLARWADLTMADARRGIAGAPGIVTITVAGRELLMAEEVLDTGPLAAPDTLPARALPGFDELVLGYRDRTAQLSPADEARVVPGGNGVFASTLVVAGEVVGTWRRRELTRRVEITATPLRALRRADRSGLEVGLRAYAAHLGKEATITWAAEA